MNRTSAMDRASVMNRTSAMNRTSGSGSVAVVFPCYAPTDLRHHHDC